VPAFGQHFDDGTGDAQLPLDRLVGVGGRADVQHQRSIVATRQRLAQLLGGVDLRDDLGLEVEPRRQVEVAVRRPCEAVDAAVFAAAVRVDRDVEMHVRRVVAGQNRLDALLDDLRGGRQVFFLHRLVERAPAVVEGFVRPLRIAVLDGPRRAAALDRVRQRAVWDQRDGAGAGHTVNIYSIRPIASYVA
jgi:hypothetical protein